MGFFFGSTSTYINQRVLQWDYTSHEIQPQDNGVI